VGRNVISPNDAGVGIYRLTSIHHRIDCAFITPAIN
jgi:hypothetical protein